MGAGTYAKQGGENVSAEIIIAGLSLLGTLAGTAGGMIAVSYTHLTLPTICSV